MQATILLNRLREDLGPVPIHGGLAGHVLFEVQTIADLAVYVEKDEGGKMEDETPLHPSSFIPHPSPMVPEERSCPLSFAQQRLWLLDQLDPGNPAYNIPMALRLSGPIDLAVLDRALEEAVARHETLRTRLEIVEDEPRQVISLATPQKLPLVDLSTVDPARREADALARAAEEARRPFPLSSVQGLWRAHCSCGSPRPSTSSLS